MSGKLDRYMFLYKQYNSIRKLVILVLLIVYCKVEDKRVVLLSFVILLNKYVYESYKDTMKFISNEYTKISVDETRDTNNRQIANLLMYVLSCSDDVNV